MFSYCFGTNSMEPFSTAFYGWLRQRLDLNEPLIGQIRLNHRARAVCARHLQLVFDDLVEQAQLVEIGNNLFARDKPV